MSRTKRFALNSLSTAVMQVVTMVMGFITPRIMLQSYGSEINGLVSSISQFISYFNLVEAGLSSAAIYALYKPLVDQDYRSINSIISAARKFYRQSGHIFISLTIALATIYPFYIKTDTLTPLNISILVFILGANGVLEFYTLSKYRVLLTADQKTYVISIASTIQIIVNTLIISILAYFKVNIVLLRFISLFSIYLRSSILMIYCKSKYKYLRYDEEPNMKALDKRWDALFLQLLGAVQTGAPVVLITLLIKDLKLVSIYTIFNMIISGIIGVLSIFTSGLSSSFGSVIASKQQETLKKAYSEFELAYYILITIVYATTFVTIMPFVKIYTEGINDINYYLPIVGFLFTLNGLFNNIKTPQGMLVISAGMYKETRCQTLIQAMILLVLGLTLAPSLGIEGILIACIISNLYRCIDLIYFIPKNVTNLPIRTTLSRVFRIFISVFIIIYTFSLMSIKISNMYNWIVYACVVFIYSVIIVLFMSLMFEKNEVINIKIRIKSMERLK